MRGEHADSQKWQQLNTELVLASVVAMVTRAGASSRVANDSTSWKYAALNSPGFLTITALRTWP